MAIEDDLALATNSQLIAELLRRPTFRGCVFWQRNCFKGSGEPDWAFASSQMGATLKEATPLVREFIDKIDRGEVNDISREELTGE